MPHAPKCKTCGRPFDKRTLDQNDRMWPMLRVLERKIDWHGNKLKDFEWKEVMSAALNRQKIVPGIDGGFVVIGSKTSQYTKQEAAEMMDLIEAFGAQQGIDWDQEMRHD